MEAQQGSARTWARIANAKLRAEREEQVESLRPAEPVPEQGPQEPKGEGQAGKEQTDRHTEASDRKQKDAERQRRDEAVDAMVAKRRMDRDLERDGGREM
jgi:hypothetical protein